MPIKIDKIDRKLLFELDKNCRTSIVQLAKKIRKSRQATEYRISQLIKKGIITSFQTAINPHKLGCQLYKFYIKLRNIPSQKEMLLKYLKSSEKVYWLGECSGSWDLIFAVFVKNNNELFDFKNEFISKFNKTLIEEEGQILLEVKQFPKMYLTGQTGNPTMFGGEIEKHDLDQTDFLILEKIVNNARISLVELSTSLKSSITKIKLRIKKLEKKGVIIQYRIGIDLKKLNMELYKAVIKFERYNKEDQKKFIDYLSNKTEVQYIIKNLWTLEPEFIVENYNGYYKIIEDLKKEFPLIIKSVDSVLMISDEWTPGFKNLFQK